MAEFLEQSEGVPNTNGGRNEEGYVQITIGRLRWKHLEDPQVA